MSFWDNVKKFAQPYADEEYDDYDDEEMDEFEEEEEVAPRPARRAPSFSTASESVSDFGVAPSAPAAPVSAPSSGFSGQVLNMHSGKQEVVLFHAKAFDDAAKAANELRNKRAVLLLSAPLPSLLIIPPLQHPLLLLLPPSAPVASAARS